MKHLIALAVAGGFALAGQAQQEVVVIADTAGPGKKVQQKVITLRLKGDQADEKKYVIEIDGDKIKVNGKDIADLKDVEVNIGKSRAFDRNNNITINGQPLSRFRELHSTTPGMSWDNGDMSPFESLAMNSNGAFLGIGMEKTDDGVKVTDVTEKSGAEKAGLKEGDVIVKLTARMLKLKWILPKP
jgi:serine protease Do